MELYQKPYFTLFSEICNTIESLETILQTNSLPEPVKNTLLEQVKNLKNTQQQTEEYLISKPYF
ncbi:MAG: hypothetical protein Q4D37_09125 [Oscillospiraceae bacterium]|nr:hypothetical protein [Oscillospiraceae bacterium]